MNQPKLPTCGWIVLACIMMIQTSSATAGVTGYLDKTEWMNAIGDPTTITTIDFTGFPETTIITDQYEDQGVTFFGFIDTINHNPNIFLNDDWGLDGNGDINLQFERPIHWIGAEYPGGLGVELYREGQLLFEGTFVAKHIVGNFGGIHSTEAFDTAILFDPTGEAAIDDLHFVIPAPGGLGLLLPLLLIKNRRRSKSRFHCTEPCYSSLRKEPECQTPSGLCARS